MSSSKNVINFRQRRKENLINLFGGKCSLCGYDKYIGSLEFHHINPQEKSYQVSSGNCHKLEDDIAECKKCLLVCANCHREIHGGLYDDVNLFSYQYFDTDIENELLHTNKREQRFCSVCEKPITVYSKSGMCSSCIQKYRTKVQNKPNREELKNLIRTKPFTEIARQYDVSDNAIRKWCDKLKLPRTKKDIDAYSDEQWEEI